MQSTTNAPSAKQEASRPQRPPLPCAARYDSSPAEQIGVPEGHPFAAEIGHSRTILRAVQMLIAACHVALLAHEEDPDCDGACMLCDSAYVIEVQANQWTGWIEGNIDSLYDEGRSEEDILEAREEVRRTLALPLPPLEPAAAKAKPVIAAHVAAELPAARTKPYWRS